VAGLTENSRGSKLLAFEKTIGKRLGMPPLRRLPPFRWFVLLPVGNGLIMAVAVRRFLRVMVAVAEFSGSEGSGLRKPWAKFAVLVGCS
jgi:hypothetical protein